MENLKKANLTTTDLGIHISAENSLEYSGAHSNGFSDTEATTPSAAVGMDDYEPEITKLLWEIMHVEAQVKWTRVEIAGIKSKQAKLEKDIEVFCRPKQKFIETYVRVAKNYAGFARNNPPEFQKTCQLLLSCEVIKQMDWMDAIRKYTVAVQSFVLQSALILIKQYGPSVPLFPRYEKPINYQAEVVSSRSTLNKHQVAAWKRGGDQQTTGVNNNEASFAQYCTKLHNLRVQREEAKEMVKHHACSLELAKMEKWNIQLSTSTLIDDLVKAMIDVEKIENVVGVAGAFNQMDSLLKAVHITDWLSPGYHCTDLEKSSLITEPGVFFRNLRDQLPKVVKAIVASQKAQYGRHWALAQEIIRNPKLEGEEYIELKRDLENAWNENVRAVMHKYQSDDEWMAIAGCETSWYKINRIF